MSDIINRKACARELRELIRLLERQQAAWLAYSAATDETEEDTSEVVSLREKWAEADEELKQWLEDYDHCTALLAHLRASDQA